MRLAGIMKAYSKSATPQLASTTSQSGELLNFAFRLPYHANVMKMFEQVSSTMGSQRDDVISMPQKMNSTASGVKLESKIFSRGATNENSPQFQLRVANAKNISSPNGAAGKWRRVLPSLRD